jgi:hypothetical protein
MLAKDNEMQKLKYLSRVTPLRSCDDPKFKWVGSSDTNVRKTFRKARLLIRLTKGSAYESRT